QPAAAFYDLDHVLRPAKAEIYSEACQNSPARRPLPASFVPVAARIDAPAAEQDRTVRGADAIVDGAGFGRVQHTRAGRLPALDHLAARQSPAIVVPCGHDRLPRVHALHERGTRRRAAAVMGDDDELRAPQPAGREQPALPPGFDVAGEQRAAFAARDLEHAGRVVAGLAVPGRMQE